MATSTGKGGGRQCAYAKTDNWVMGIDEAGRGPVLGAMLYGACMCPESKLSDLQSTGVFDSKQLTDEQRRELFAVIKKSDYLEWIIDSIPADWMSDMMIRENRFSLNEISHNSAMDMIQKALDNGFNVTHVFLDTVGPPESYEQKLRNHFMGFDIKFTVAKKADALYPVVSAASICAKVTRDDILENWTFVERNLRHLSGDGPQTTTKSGEAMDDSEEEGGGEGETSTKGTTNKGKGKKVDEGHWLGNGYPGHEKTKQFMQKYSDAVFGYPNMVRFSWQTAKTIIEARCAKVTFADEQADNNLRKWGFSGGSKVKRAKYFKQANLGLCFESPF